MFRAFMWVMAGFSFSGLVATNALAASVGEIRFQGAIVDGECSFSVRDGSMDGKCYQQGRFTRVVSPLAMMAAPSGPCQNFITFQAAAFLMAFLKTSKSA